MKLIVHRAARNAATTLVTCSIAILASVPAAADVERSSGATVYVPVYSQVYHGPKVRPFQLAATASVRNTDAEHSITVVRADYYDFDGKKVRGYVSSPIVLGPLATREFQVRENDRTGGAGANFIVEWKADRDVTMPLIEGLMIGTAAGQGISFTSRGQIIK